MRTLVFGAKGQLGRNLLRVMGEWGETAGHDMPELDICDAAAVQRAVDAFEPDVVINAAAYTDVEKAELDRALAFRVNRDGAAVVAAAARKAGASVIYYSTDYVFAGDKNTPYEPNDPVEPKGVYAESKAAGEEATRAAHPGATIIRTAWLYGPGGNNFIEKILRAAASRPSLRVVDDEIGSPTFTQDLCEATRALCEVKAAGAFHAVNRGACSRFEYARAILRLAGVKTPIEPCKAIEFPSAAPRPAYSVLSNAALEAACGYSMATWEDALGRYMGGRKDHT